MSLRNWLFTLNNPAGIDISFVDYDWVKCAVWQLEQGSGGTPHLQGYVECRKTVRINALKSIPELRDAHFEARRGTRQQAYDYCTKEDTRVDGPFEYGDFDGDTQGKRNDLVEVYNDMKKKVKIEDILDKYPATVMRYIGNIQKVYPLLQPARKVLPAVLYLFGAPGTGKTSWLRHVYKEAYWHMPGSNWFTGYVGQKVCIFDEYNGNLQINLMNRLTDDTECYVEIKGASVKFISEIVIICCNRLLDDIYVNSAEKQHAPLNSLKRRITTSYWFIEPWVYWRFNTYAEMEATITGTDKTIRSIEGNIRYIANSLPRFEQHIIEDDVSTEEADPQSEFEFELTN